MFIHVEGLSLPKGLKFYLRYEDSEGTGSELIRKPDHLIRLGEAPWPDWIKARIKEFYVDFGIEDPYRQKLVEPGALAFGGSASIPGNTPDGVDWQEVLDYFEWEVVELKARLTSDNYYRSRSELLQERAAQKYGHRFDDFETYEDPRPREQGSRMLFRVQVPRSPFDRRSGNERRRTSDTGFFKKAGIDRRHCTERRRIRDRRAGLA